MKQLLLLLVFALNLAACSTPVSNTAQIDNGFGGTGNTSGEESGFGGTGKQLAFEEESGFGGTGVIGTVEAFGSIWVNGLHIQFDHQQSVSANLLGQFQIAIGHQVLLRAEQTEQTILSHELALHFPLAGKVTEIRRQHLLVNKHWVRWNTETQLDKNWQNPEKIKLGDYVIVSGYQLDSGTWVATRLSENAKKIQHFESEITWPFQQRPNRFVIESTLKSRLSPALKNLKPNQRILRSGRFSSMGQSNQRPSTANNNLQQNSDNRFRNSIQHGSPTMQSPMMRGQRGGH